MRYWKMRLLGVVVIVVFAGLLYYEWQRLWQEARYNLKIAAFAPLVIIGGLFILLFPARAGKPETVSDKLIAFLVFAIGVLAGVVNVYLMDPGFFPF
jgi:peptidoglycan/LPS O-acetylase OafA/YrhL